SKSMRATDPGGLARLSTVLLYDLARPDVTLDDSFEVLPFHPTRRWQQPTDPPPTAIGTRIRPAGGQRTAFADAIRGLGYDAEWTYFYPGLLAAISDLESTPGGQADVRVVVILTDGLPEKPTRDEEARRIRAELQPRLAAARIWLYVLAFGQKAHADRAFFDRLVRTDAGETLGAVFVDPTGDDLLGHMIELFGHAFGYTRDAPRPAARQVEVDLDGGTTPTRAALVVHAPRPTPPSLELAAPTGAPRAPTAPAGVETAADEAASYAVQWVLSPYPGAHRLRTDATAGTVAVLRPTRLRLEVRAPAGRQSLRTMARTPFPLDVLVRPGGGATGDPGEVQLSFEAHGQRLGFDPVTGVADYAWDGGPGAPPSGPSRPTTEGRVYAIQPSFERDPEPEEPFYKGYLEIEARRGAAVVGSLVGADAHRVEVFPRVRIVPSPGLADAVVDGEIARALGQGERACARFTFELDVGRLPHPDQPLYPLRAELAAGLRLEGPLQRASFTLDGLPLEVAGAARDKSAPTPEWSTGRGLDRDALLGEHEMCVTLGRPVQSDEVKLEIPLDLTLLESPYDDFDVVEPFALAAWVARPGLFDRWRTFWILGALALAALLALWYLRDRPSLPDDLRVAIARASATDEPSLVSLPLARGPFWRRLLGLVEAHPLSAPEEDRVVARVVPTRDELFRLVPARGVRASRIDAAGAPLAVEARRGLAVGAHERVRLATDDGELVCRLEYTA
ncbi:MAG: hypothetical protein AAGE94_19615, partial [Acidobacteriota bacterium]